MSPLDMLRCGAWPSLQVRIRLARRWFSARGVNPMRRREFIRLFSSTVVAWSLTARAQQSAMPVVGFMISGIQARSQQIAASATTPIVFGMGGDPVALGLVDSLSHPGSNITGIYFFTQGLEGKRLGLLHELVPT